MAFLGKGRRPTNRIRLRLDDGLQCLLCRLLTLAGLRTENRRTSTGPRLGTRPPCSASNTARVGPLDLIRAFESNTNEY